MTNSNLSILFLSTFMPWGLILPIVALLLGAAVGYFVYKTVTDKKVGSADERVRNIISAAEADAERIKNQGKEESKRALKEALLEANEHYLKLRNEF